jgi:hypothetical protein
MVFDIVWLPRHAAFQAQARWPGQLKDTGGPRHHWVGDLRGRTGTFFQAVYS